MHGVRRGTRPDEAEAALASAQAALATRALSARRGPRDANAARLSERALESNPDEYSLWALRREMLQECGGDERWDAELALTMRALRRHPKAYPAWQHRLWLLEEGCGVSDTLRARRMEEERALSAAMLAQDGRNFHGWAHRMRIRAMSPGGDTVAGLREELRFVTGKINEDFANYSAWHHRSALLPRIYARPADFLQDELDFVRQAFYTEPDVQSAWFYHRWLLAGAPARGKHATVDEAVWRDELRACDELLEIEPTARHAMHTKAHILAQLGRAEEARSVFDDLISIVRCHCVCVPFSGIWFRL